MGAIGCREVREGLTEYLEEALPPERRQGFDAHLATCPGCARHARQLGLTTELLSRLPREPMPPDLRGRLLDALRGRNTG